MDDVLLIGGRVLNGLLAPLATRLMRWALADTSERHFSPQ